MTNTVVPRRHSTHHSRPRSRTDTCTAAPSLSCSANRALHPRRGGGAKDGTLQPTDYTDVNHSFAFGAGDVISTATDLATWMKALGGGKVLDAEYQSIWLDSATDRGSQEARGKWYGYGIAQRSGDPTRSTSTAARPPGYNSEAATTPPTT